MRKTIKGRRRVALKLIYDGVKNKRKKIKEKLQGLPAKEWCVNGSGGQERKKKNGDTRH